MKNLQIDLQESIEKTFQEVHSLLDSKPKTRNKSELFENPKTTKHTNSSKLVQRNFYLRPTSRYLDRSSKLAESRFSYKPKTRLNQSAQIISETLKKQHPVLKSAENDWEKERDKEIVKFIKGLRGLKKLKLELLDLYDLARNYERKEETDEANLFFNIQSELNSEFYEIKAECLEDELVNLACKFLHFSKELVKIVKGKGGKDSALLVEYLARFHVKILDSASQGMMKTIQSLEKSHELSISMMKSIKKEDLKIVNEIFKAKSGESEKSIEMLTVQNEEMRKIIVKLRSELNEKEREVDKLTELDHGFSAIQSMDHLLRNLESVIIDAKDQKREKARMIKDFQNFFESVEELNRPTKLISKETMTDWSILNLALPLPFYRFPVLTNNPLAGLKPGKVIIAQTSIKEKVIESILKFQEKSGFLFHLAETFFSFFSEPQEKISAMYEVTSQILAGHQNWQILSKKLLGFEGFPEKIIEKNLLHCRRLFETFIKYENSDTFIETAQFIQTIEKDLKNYPKFQSWVLSRLKIYNEKSSEDPKESHFSSFCMRFSLNFEKQKISLKQSLERIDRSGSISFEQFFNYLRKKLNFVIIIQELTVIWQDFRPDERNMVEINTLLQELNFNYNLQLVKSTKISLIDFLLNSFNFFTSELKDFEKHTEKFSEFLNSESLSSYFQMHSISFPENRIEQIISHLLFGEDVSKICENFNIYPFDLLQLSLTPGKQKILKKKNPSKYIS